MTDINDILSRCKVQVINTKEAKDGDLWVFTLDDGTSAEITALKACLSDIKSEFNARILIWRNTLGDIRLMPMTEAVALRDILNEHIDDFAQSVSGG